VSQIWPRPTRERWPKLTQIADVHRHTKQLRDDVKIFTTLWKGDGVVLLTKEQQKALVKSRPKVFKPVKGGWGRKGSTMVILRAADRKTVHHALSLAWSNKAPKTSKPRSN
jgi:hypothetical protein